MNNKVYLVTGATSGLGKAVALELAKNAGTVILVGRDAQRGAQVEKEIASATKNANTDLQLSDLSNLSSIRNLAEILNSKYGKIDVLINNAGIYRRQRAVTVDGFEEMFATNHLGPFLLTHLLLDCLLASVSARIVNVSAPSTTHLNFDDLQGEREFKSLSAFGASKMANLLFTFELARRTADSHIRVNAYHPGLVRSPLMNEAAAPIRFLTRLFSSPPQRAAHDLVQLSIAPEFENTHGKFLHRGKEIKPSTYALDPLNQSKLWEVSERLTGISQVQQTNG